jgi:hypothetical protein
VSVLMEVKTEKSKGKRLTKNSKELRAEETDLEGPEEVSEGRKESS